jgi:hypothetical protein
MHGHRQHETRESNLSLTTPQPTLGTDLVLPVLQGLVVGLIAFGCASGLIWVLGAAWTTAWHWGLGLGLSVFGVCAAAFIFEHRSLVTAPVRLAFRRLELEYPPEPEPPPPPRFIPIRGRRLLTEPVPQLPQPAIQTPRQVIAGFLADRLAARSRETVYESTGGDLDAAPEQVESWPHWVVEMYGILEATYPTGALSRRDFERLFSPGGTGKWTRYVNGDPSKPGHRGKSVFQLWGIISQTGPRGTWEYCHDWQTIIHLDRDLLAYAQAQDGDHSPGNHSPDQVSR